MDSSSVSEVRCDEILLEGFSNVLPKVKDTVNFLIRISAERMRVAANAQQSLSAGVPTDPGAIQALAVAEFLMIDDASLNKIISQLFLFYRYGYPNGTIRASPVEETVKTFPDFQMLFPYLESETEIQQVTQWIVVLQSILKIDVELQSSFTNIVLGILAYEFRGHPVVASTKKQRSEMVRQKLVKLKPAQLRILFNRLSRDLGTDFQGFFVESNTTQNDVGIDKKQFRLRWNREKEEIFKAICRDVEEIVVIFVTDYLVKYKDEWHSLSQNELKGFVKQLLLRFWPNANMNEVNLWTDLIVSLLAPVHDGKGTLSPPVVRGNIKKRVKGVVDFFRNQELSATILVEKYEDKDNPENRSRAPGYLKSDNSRTSEQSPQLLPRRWQSADTNNKQPPMIEAEPRRDEKDYKVKLSRRFLDQAKSIHPQLLKYLRERGVFDKISQNPYGFGSKKSPRVPDAYRVGGFTYVGTEYRIAFRIDGTTITLSAIGSREGFYESSIGHLN
jgi:hypothetical protein